MVNIITMKITQKQLEQIINEATEKFIKEVGPKAIHTKKWDKCVKKVEKNDEVDNPYAVCTSSIGYEDSVKKSHQNKSEELDENIFQQVGQSIKQGAQALTNAFTPIEKQAHNLALQILTNIKKQGKQVSLQTMVNYLRNYFKGQLKEIVIQNKILSQSDILPFLSKQDSPGLQLAESTIITKDTLKQLVTEELNKEERIKELTTRKAEIVNCLNKYNLLNETKKWSSEVTKNVKPSEHSKEGVFTKSASVIAQEMLKKSEGNPTKAFHKIDFYIKRAGENLTNSVEVKKARRILRKKIEKNKN